MLQEVKANHTEATTLINVLKEYLPMCEHIYSFRNAQEHAATTDTPLIVNNFSFENGNELNAPKWGLQGQGLKYVYEEANEILSFLISFFEEVFFVVCVVGLSSLPKI